MNSPRSSSRRRFLAVSGWSLAAALARFRSAWALEPGPHPEPRAGITAAGVLPRDRLDGSSDVQEAFELVREIPQIVDGIRCQCGCADLPGFYSLLSCYEGEGMARHCHVCQGEARLAHRLHKAGKSLQDIRRAVDARYG